MWSQIPKINRVFKNRNLLKLKINFLYLIQSFCFFFFLFICLLLKHPNCWTSRRRLNLITRFFCLLNLYLKSDVEIYIYKRRREENVYKQHIMLSALAQLKLKYFQWNSWSVYTRKQYLKRGFLHPRAFYLLFFLFSLQSKNIL